MIKCVVVSDTHTKHDSFKDDLAIPNGDIFFHCGDFTMKGTESQIRKFNKFLGTLDFKHKIVIAGNHEV